MELKEYFAELQVFISETTTNLESRLEKRMDVRFEAFGNRLDGFESAVGARIDGVETKLSNRIDGVEKTLGGQIDKLGAAMADMDDKLNTLVERTARNDKPRQSRRKSSA